MVCSFRPRDRIQGTPVEGASLRMIKPPGGKLIDHGELPPPEFARPEVAQLLIEALEKQDMGR